MESKEKYRVEPLDVKVPEQVSLSSLEEEVIKTLEKLAKKWPKTLKLFSFSGSLCVVRDKTGEILTTIRGIPNGGGDPGSYTDEKTGREFLSLE